MFNGFLEIYKSLPCTALNNVPRFKTVRMNGFFASRKKVESQCISYYKVLIFLEETRPSGLRV
jgi:hypothetical protein